MQEKPFQRENSMCKKSETLVWWIWGEVGAFLFSFSSSLISSPEIARSQSLSDAFPIPFVFQGKIETWKYPRQTNNLVPLQNNTLKILIQHFRWGYGETIIFPVMLIKEVQPLSLAEVESGFWEKEISVFCNSCSHIYFLLQFTESDYLGDIPKNLKFRLCSTVWNSFQKKQLGSMHDLISEFQLTSSAAAHGKTNQQTGQL